MSPEERKIYMREYMRARRAAIKNGEQIPTVASSQAASDSPGEYEYEYEGVSPLPIWVIVAILGGIGVVVIGLAIFTCVSNKRDKEKDNLDASEDTPNIRIVHNVPTPNTGQNAS